MMLQQRTEEDKKRLAWRYDQAWRLARRAATLLRRHRVDRCDWSLFYLGLALLDHFLNEHLPIPVTFNFWLPNCVWC